MSTTDFFCPYFIKKTSVLIGILSCLALTANAEPPAADTFTHSNELVLTLSDKWMDASSTTQNAFSNSGKPKNLQLITETPKSKPAAIGCGMDVSSIPTTDSSLTSRVVGKCNFNFRY